MAKPRPKAEAPSSEPSPADAPAGISDGWLSLAFLLLFLAVCLATWWLSQRFAPPGAPGAPMG